MEESWLQPFLRKDLDILFIGLNPAGGSSRKGHYFSVNKAFWNQLREAELITLDSIDKLMADELVFGGTDYNAHGWSYGITDLVTEIAESDSGLIKPGRAECERLERVIRELEPRAAVLIHGKVVQRMLEYRGLASVPANSGALGRILPGCATMFFNIAFPHGNTIAKAEKVREYCRVKAFLEEVG
jgi:hypothetical protein